MRPIAQKQGASIYTVLLILSLVFMLIAVIAMWMEVRRYQPDYWKATTAAPAAGMIVFPL